MTDLIFSEDVSPIDWSDVRTFGIDYGVKSSTTFALPRAWTPEFVALPAKMAQQIKSKGQFTNVLDEKALARIRGIGGKSGGILVRSSVVGESIWDRGTYKSIPVDCGSKDFVARLCAAAVDVVGVAPNEEIGLLIQRYIRPIHRGEFGNLLRISRTRDH